MCWLIITRQAIGAEVYTFHAVIPVYQSDSLWDRVLGALNPDRWATGGGAVDHRGRSRRALRRRREGDGRGRGGVPVGVSAV